MSKATQHDRQCILFQVEDTYGVPEAAAPTAMLAVDDFNMDVYTGDQETLEMFCKGEGVRSRPTLMNNQHSTMSFGLYLTFPDAPGALTAWSSVARACNLDATILSDSVVYTQSSTGATDSGTLRRLMEYDASSDHEYVSAGCRGQLDLVLEHMKRPRFQISNMLGSYNRPDLAAIISPECSDLIQNLAENLAGATTNEISLAGHDLCAKKITIKNIGGVTLSRDGFLCPGGEQTLTEEAQTTIDIEFENSDWPNEFNPFEISESHAGVTPVRFLFDHGAAGSGIKFECLKVQPTNPNVIKTVAGRKGISMELLCLGSPELTIY